MHSPPGPTGLPFLGNLLQIPTDQPWVYFSDLSKKYGEIVQLSVLGQTLIILNSFEAADALFIKSANKYANKPVRSMADLSGFNATLPFMDPCPAFNSAREQFHAELGPHPMTKYHPDLESASQRFVQWLASNLSCQKLEEGIDRSLGQLFLRVATGYRAHDDDPILSRINGVANFAAHILGGTYDKLDQLPFLKHLPRWAPGAGPLRLAAKWKKQLAQTADDTVKLAQDSLKDDSSNTSFMGDVLNAKPEEANDEQFKMVAVSITAGGMLALESAHLSLLYTMSRFPEVQQRAQAELDSVLSGRPPTIADRPNLPYTDAVVSEILRWVPIAPLIGRQVMEDDEYNGFRIPKGATIMVNNWAISRDPNVYADPLEFRPERFLEKGEDGKPSVLSPATWAKGAACRLETVKCTLAPRTTDAS
ncbi:O-methylsterigmatocystin oxidoreductase [Grifola frondosa]|uniref:O-methylsterigmatocystin oxidoreductase n=1 Tax=Grifola frondosa TaxID=5627 RepID=A0A1C7MF06_GRIFR|nr:O-methylsterigmatocystin oxidoreductase [Grifola frondosa]